MWNIFNRWRQGELRHFAPLFNIGTAPSSGHLLHCAKTINLMKLLLMEYCVLSTGPSESLEDDITENCEQTGFNENTRCTNNGSAVLQASATGEPAILDDEAIASIATSLGTSRLGSSWLSWNSFIIIFYYIFQNVRDDYKILHMDPDRSNIFFMDRKIKSSLKIGLVVLQNILSYYVFKLSATSTRSLPGCCPFWQVMSASNTRSLSWTRWQKIWLVSNEKSII